jgi:arsenate reductase-like glutaredoxin family protein
VHFVDLNVKAISKGELESVERSVPLEELMDKEGRLYEKMNLKYISHDVKEKILENSLLLKTPLVRFSGKATVGYTPDTWAEWIKGMQ